MLAAAGAMALAVALLIATGRRQSSWPDALYLAAALSAMCWLGIKHTALAVLVSSYFLLRSDRTGRIALIAAGSASAGLFTWFHLQVFGSLTPYGVKVVYANWNTLQIGAHFWPGLSGTRRSLDPPGERGSTAGRSTPAEPPQITPLPSNSSRTCAVSSRPLAEYASPSYNASDEPNEPLRIARDHVAELLQFEYDFRTGRIPDPHLHGPA